MSDNIQFANQAREHFANRNQYWAMLRKARSAFFKEHPRCSEDDFYSHLTDAYGIRALSGGYVASQPEVIDEKLYFLFVLKWS